MSKLSKVQAFVAILLIFSSFGSYANAASETGNLKTTNTDSGKCYTSGGLRIPCPQ